MKESKLKLLFETHKVGELEWVGKCRDCKTDTSVVARLSEEGQISVSGGAVYEPELCDETFLKCDECFSKDRTLKNFQPCEVYSRVVGYLRPIKQWNNSKRCEHSIRKYYKIPEGELV